MNRVWISVLATLAVMVLLDVMAANGVEFRGSGAVVFLVVIFFSYWAGLIGGLLSSFVIVAYIPVAANMPWSVAYQLPDMERRLIGAAIVFPMTALIVGVVQNKLRSARARAFDADRALAKSERVRGLVVDSAMDAIVAIDLEGRVTLWNPSAERTFGWTREEMIGRTLSETIIPSAHRDAHESGLAQFRASGEGKVLGQRLELTAMHKDGSEFDVELTIVHERIDSQDAFIAFVRDISVQKKMARELLASQKLESIGQLAGGVAHDFNNVLNVIVGYGEIAKSQVPAESEAQGSLDEILRAARRSAEINNQLLAFARKQPVEPRTVSLNEVIEGVRPMIRTLIRSNIEIAFKLSDDLWPVSVDPGKVEQILTNLAINARDAMPEGGRLLIETRNIYFGEEGHLPVPDLPPGDYATISVSDTGEGIPAENLGKVFDPFFTTKEKGTGLGLAGAYGTVKQAGGRIAVYSEVGHGTMFRIYLPRALGEVESILRPSPLRMAQPGTETVLVAEDNEQVRTVIVLTLTQFGYNVIDAKSGSDALALAAAFDGVIHLLVTDLIMPNGGGTELARQLRAVRPEVKVIFLSGYTEEAVTATGVEGIDGAFLQKPVLPTDLAAKIREVLDG